MTDVARVEVRRLLFTAFGCSVVVFGGAFALGSGPAEGASKHVCSVADKQFLQTVSWNMDQLSFWSDQLGSGEAKPGVVVHQAFSEADQVGATRPEDPTLFRARGMLRVMFTEYGRAIRAKTHGGDAGKHMGLSWRLAYDVHDVLAEAQPQLAGLGCDPGSLISKK